MFKFCTLILICLTLTINGCAVGLLANAALSSSQANMALMGSSLADSASEIASDKRISKNTVEKTLIIGTTTKSEIEKLYGKPTNDIKINTGNIWEYTNKVTGFNKNNLLIEFDAKGKVKHYSFN